MESRALRPFAEIPGPPPRFLVGELSSFKNALPWEVCARYAASFGGLTRIKILGKHIVVLNDAEAIADALIHKKDALYKERPRDALLPLSTEAGAFVSPGGAHWKARRDAMPAERPDYAGWLGRRIPAMQEVIAARCGDLSKQASFDAYNQLLRLAFDVVSVALVGRELGDEAYQCFLDLAVLGDRRIRWQLPFGMPWGSKGDALVERWFGYFRAAVQETRNDLAARDDVFALQIKSGTALSDDALAIETANNYFGGCFSATTSILTTLYELTQAPGERAKLIGALRKQNADGALFNARSLLSHPELDQAYREALRLRPPVALFVRKVQANADLSLGGYRIPPKTAVFISCYALHRSKDHWGPDAETFRPSRWEGDVTKANPFGSGHFFPFGRGERSCVGEHFAILYTKLVLASLLLHGEMEVGAHQDFNQEIFFATMRPVGLVGRLPSTKN